MSERPNNVPVEVESPGVEVLRRVMASFDVMSDAELLEFSVRAGIHEPDGRLSAAYGGSDGEQAVAEV